MPGFIAVGISGLISISAAAAPPRDGRPVTSAVVDVQGLPDRADAPTAWWVFFEDKGMADVAARDAALQRLTREYHPRAVERRRLRRTGLGLFDERDLLVADRYASAVEAAGGTIRVRSRWLNAVSVTADAEEIRAIAGLPFVERVKPLGRSRGVERMVPVPEDLMPPADTYGLSRPQLEQINLIALHERGHLGEGVVIGVLDTGFVVDHRAFQHPDKPLNVVAQHDFVNDDSNVGYEPGDDPEQHAHGTIILGVLAGYEPGTFIGAAPDASYILCKTEDATDEYTQEEDFYVAGLEFIEANGGDVATSSLGYIEWYTQDDLDGRTAVTTVAVNVATENGVYCCTAAGNEGNDQDPTTSHLMAPGDAFDVITAGAVAITGEPPGFSSDGPTADGRVKPELIAIGDDAYSISPYDAVSYSSYSGTSMATPHVAGVVACLAGARPAWTVGAMRSRLFESASIFRDTGTFDPYFISGYGIPDALAAFDALYFEGVTPAVAGRVNHLAASSAAPGARVAFVWGRRAGQTAVPNCPALSVGIAGARLAAMATANGAGRAVASVHVPGAAGGRDILFQAVEPDACRTSNEATIRFE